MSATVDIRLADLYTKVGQLFQSIVGIDPDTSALVPVVQGQGNRVPMPNVPFMLVQAFRAGRVRTNVDTWAPITQLQSSEQGTKVKVQLDCYGPDSETWANMVSTLWRDFYACDQLAPTCQPLYGDEPFQGALIDGEDQYEERWTVELYLQYNPVTTIVQQSATALAAEVINVDERYPP